MHASETESTEALQSANLRQAGFASIIGKSAIVYAPFALRGVVRHTQAASGRLCAGAAQSYFEAIAWTGLDFNCILVYI